MYRYIRSVRNFSATIWHAYPVCRNASIIREFRANHDFRALRSLLRKCTLQTWPTLREKQAEKKQRLFHTLFLPPFHPSFSITATIQAPRYSNFLTGSLSHSLFFLQERGLYIILQLRPLIYEPFSPREEVPPMNDTRKNDGSLRRCRPEARQRVHPIFYWPIHAANNAHRALCTVWWSARWLIYRSSNL